MNGSSKRLPTVDNCKKKGNEKFLPPLHSWPYHRVAINIMPAPQNVQCFLPFAEFMQKQSMARHNPIQLRLWFYRKKDSLEKYSLYNQWY